MNNPLIQNHPKGLYLLFFMEMWERFSYYGMRSLLVLYMVENLLYSTQKAGNIYGFYTGLVYLTPILGGYLADRYLGQRKSVSIGAILMVLGLFLLFIGGEKFFLFSLFILVIANGFFKPNISSLLGLLYEKDKEKKDSAFTIFYLGINIGAFFSPLICATLALKYGYNYGFLAGGIGVLIGFIIYKLFENKLLKNYGLKPIAKSKETKNGDKLTKRQIKRILALFILMFFVIIFWVCYEQAGSSLTLFAQYSTNRNFLKFKIPSSYFQSLNPLFIMILAPIASYFWIYLKNKNIKITSVDKFFMGLVLISVSFLIMALAGLNSTTLVSPLWLVLTYFIMTMAELCLSPIGLSLVSKLSPKKFMSLLMGIWFLTSFFGNLLAGFWGGKYGKISNFSLFFTLSLISLISAFALLIIMPKLKRIIGKI